MMEYRTSLPLSLSVSLSCVYLYTSSMPISLSVPHSAPIFRRRCLYIRLAAFAHELGSYIVLVCGLLLHLLYLFKKFSCACEVTIPVLLHGRSVLLRHWEERMLCHMPLVAVQYLIDRLSLRILPKLNEINRSCNEPLVLAELIVCGL